MIQTNMAWVGVSVIALALGGCGAPKGDSGGRIDPYRTTESDRRSHRASIPVLMEFSDRVAEELIQQIADMDAVKNAGNTKLVLAMGGIENHTSTPTNDFQQIRNRIRTKIFQSDVLRKNFMVIEDRGRMQAERDREVGTQKDLLQEGKGEGKVATYDPNITYKLLGTFSLSSRGNRQQYLLTFQLVNLGTREIVFEHSFDDARLVAD